MSISSRRFFRGRALFARDRALPSCHEFAKEHVVPLRALHHQRPVAEIIGTGAAIAASLENHGQQLVRAKSNVENARTRWLRCNLPFLVESRALRALLVLRTWVDREDRDRAGTAQRQRAGFSSLVPKREGELLFRPAGF